MTVLPADAAVAFCGSCGSPVPPATSDAEAAPAPCSRCGAALSPARPASTGALLFQGVTPASVGMSAARILIDVALLAAGIAAAVVVGRWIGGVWLVLLLAVAAVVVVAGRTGRTPGCRMLGLRVVDALDACAPGPARIVVPVGTMTADLRRGRDPLGAPPLPPEWTGAYATLPRGLRPERSRTAAPVAAQGEPRHPPLTITLDSGQRVVIASEAVLGRGPSDLPPAVTPVAWPDMSRTLSKAHARLEWDGATVWITDLGSTNGSAYEVDGEEVPLLPHVRSRVPLEAVVSMGERTLTLRPPVVRRASPIEWEVPRG